VVDAGRGVALPSDRVGGRLHRRVTLGLQATLLLGVVLQLVHGQWLNGAATTAVLILTLLPLMLGRRFDVFIPSEFELLAAIMVFASLFLGEVEGYFLRFWWWDVVLHAGSGFLLGMVGFLLVFVLNQKEAVAVQMKAGFVALFAFAFSLALGVIWEILEFAADQLLGTNMQKSGLVDTMWDLIVDAAAALAIAALGYVYMKRPGEDSFLERWIGAFIRSNPRLFRGEP
jgi:hypothetical protein